MRSYTLFENHVKYPLYFGSVGLLYISYFVLFFGLFKINTQYVHILSTFVHVFICLFLILRFNPFVKAELRPYDSNIIFGSALLLLFNVVLSELGLKKTPQNTTKNTKDTINTNDAMNTNTTIIIDTIDTIGMI